MQLGIVNKRLDVIHVVLICVVLLIAYHAIVGRASRVGQSTVFVLCGRGTRSMIVQPYSRKERMTEMRGMRFSIDVTPKKVSTKTKSVAVKLHLYDESLTDCGVLTYRLKRNDNAWDTQSVDWSYSFASEEPVKRFRVARVIASNLFASDDNVIPPLGVLFHRVKVSRKVKQIDSSGNIVPDEIPDGLSLYRWSHDGHDYDVFAENAKAAARAIGVALFDNADRDTRRAFLMDGEEEALVEVQPETSDVLRYVDVATMLGIDLTQVNDPVKEKANARSRKWHADQRAKKAAAKAAAETETSEK